jgi:CBS domain-containing protein
MKTTFEAAHRTRPIEELRVIDAMHPGMISCSPETPLPTVARMMATYRVHAIIVHAHNGEKLSGADEWGVVTDADLISAALDNDLDGLTAQQVAATPALTLATADPLARAIQVMVEHEVSHVIAVERHSGRPIGVVSTLDVARALAGLLP